MRMVKGARAMYVHKFRLCVCKTVYIWSLMTFSRYPRGTFRQVLTGRIRLSFVVCAYPDLRDLLHNFRGLQWISL